MKKIFEHYGDSIAEFVVAICLVAILIAFLKNDSNGIVYSQFASLLQNFFTTIQSQLSGVLGGGTP